MLLTPHAATVEEHNRHFVRALRSERVDTGVVPVNDVDDDGVIRLHAAHELNHERNSEISLASDEFFASVHESGVPPPVLEVKVGCLLMIARNYLPDQGVLNGAAAVLLHASPHVLRVRLLSNSLVIS